MSKEIDEKVVSMQFDNKNFEKNVQTSLSTLDKLKKSLRFDGASKGFENISASAKRIDFSNLSNSIETVRAKFSAFEVMGVTALANITNSAVNAGKRIVSALTIQPVTTGFSEYELKMNSIQTILASTGEDLSTVNRYLNELNEYSDKTIYSFSDMTTNIGKFTNAGVKLEDAVAAIQGISNEAAVSGANANEASRAMYNFAQALSAGYVKLIDWKSIENANMATVEFKDQLISTALELGTVTKTADGMYKTLEGNAFNATKNFNEVLQDQWMTSDVLITTLKRYADETTDIGKKAFASAQDVKTLSQLFDTLKESAQSGWAQTWELLIGDLEGAKSFLTGLSNTFGGFIEKMSKVRNDWLSNILGNSKWNEFNKRLEKAGVSTEQFKNALGEAAKEQGKIKVTPSLDDLIKKHGSLEAAISSGAISTSMINRALTILGGTEYEAGKSTDNMTDKLEYFQKVVGEVWQGDYKNGEERVKALTDAGYNYAEVQSLVNKTVDGHKLTLEDLSDAQLENVGYTKEEIKAIRALAEEAKKTGTPLNQLIEDMQKPTGRQLLLGSLTNLAQGFVKALEAIGTAWRNVFPSDGGAGVYKLLEGFNKFTSGLNLNQDQIDKLVRTFQGLFALLDVGLTIVSGPLKIVFKILSSILEAFGYNILDVTAIIGDSLVSFRDFVDSFLDFGKVFELIKPHVSSVIKWFQKLFDTIRSSNNLQFDIFNGIATALSTVVEWLNSVNFGPFEGFVSVIKNIISGMGNFFNTLKDSDNIAGDLIAGLVNGLLAGIPTVLSLIFELGKGILDTIKNVLGIHSPSTIAFAIAMYFIQGFWNGIKKYAPKVFEIIGTFADAILNVVKEIFEVIRDLEFSEIDWGAIFAAASLIGIILTIQRVTTVFEKLIEPLSGVNNVLNSTAGLLGSVSRVVNSASKVMNAFAFAVKMEAIKTVATAVLMLAGAVAILTLVDTDKLKAAVTALGVVMLELAILMAFVNKTASGKAADNGAMIGLLLGLAGIMITMGIVMTILSKMNETQMAAAIGGLVVIILAMVALLYALKLMVKDDAKGTLDKVGSTLIMMSVSMLLMAAVAKIMGGMDNKELLQGLLCIGVFTLILTSLIKSTMMAGSQIAQASKVILAAGAAMMLMALTIKMVGGMEPEKLFVGLAALTYFAMIVISLIRVTNMAGSNGSLLGAGAVIAGAGFAMLMMAAVAKIIANMSWDEMGKAAVGILALAAIISGLLLVVKYVGGGEKDLKGVAPTLMAAAISIGILAAAAVLLGMVETDKLVKGISVIGVLSVAMVALIKATRGANDCMKNIIAITAAIVVMAGAVALISLIDTTRLAVASACLVGLMLALSKIVEAAGKVQMNKKVFGTFATMLLVVVSLSAVLWALSELVNMSPEQAITNVGSLVVLMYALTGVLAIFDKMKIKTNKGDIKSLKTSIIALTALAVPLAAFGLVLAMMSALGTDNVVTNAAALTTMMYAMIGIFAIIDQMKIKTNKGDIKSLETSLIALTALAIPLAAFGLVLAMISALNVTNAIPNVIALSILMLAMSGVLAILSLIGNVGGQAILGVLALTTLVVPLMLFVMVLSMMDCLKNATQNATILGTLVGVLTLVLIPLTIIGLAAPAALMGILALTAMAVPMLAFIGVLALMDSLPNAIANTYVLIDLMVVMTSLLTQLAIIGPFALIGVAALGALTTLMIAIGGFATAIGGLMELCPFLEDFLDRGLGILEKLAHGIGSIIGNLISGFGEAIASSLPYIGEQLATFAINVMPFILTMRLVNDKVLEGVGILVNAILALTAANFISGVTSLLPFAGSFADLGTELSTFILNAMPFIIAASMIRPEMMDGVKTLADTILLLTASNILEGLLSFLSGGRSSLSAFGEEIAKFGPSIRDFADSVSGLDEHSLTAMDIAATAAEKLATMADKMPKSGGLLGGIFGESNPAEFGRLMTSFGQSLVAYGESVADLTQDEIDAITRSTEAAQGLSDLANSMPKSDSLLGMITGSPTEINTFGEQLEAFGGSLVTYAGSVEDLTKEKVDAIDTSITATEKLIALADTLPDGNGLFSIFDGGTTTIEQFGTQLADFGTSLSSFSTSVSGIDIAKITASATAAQKLGDMAVAISGADTVDLNNFGYELDIFGGHVKNYFTSIGLIPAGSVTNSANAVAAVATFSTGFDPDKAIAAANAGLHLVKMALGMSTVSSSSTAGFVAAMKNLGEVEVSAFIDSLNAGYDDIRNAARTMIDALTSGLLETVKNSAVFNAGTSVADKYAKGIESNSSKANTAGKSMADDAVDGADGVSAYDAGVDFVSGFANGISENTFEAEAKAKAMGEAALEAAREAIRSASPSKETYKLGTYFDQGFANAISDGTKNVYAISSEMGASATSGLRDAISRIGDAVNGDLNVQPTIRPVLDLTDVRSGASAINGMLASKTLSLDTRSVGSASASMSGRQNGSDTYELLSTMKGLRKDIANMPRETYQIGGITYDDGSNIHEAVKTLVRATRVEKRV